MRGDQGVLSEFLDKIPPTVNGYGMKAGVQLFSSVQLRA